MVWPHRAIHQDARQARCEANRARGEGSRTRDASSPYCAPSALRLDWAKLRVSIASGLPNASSGAWRMSRAPGRDRATSRPGWLKRARVSRKRKTEDAAAAAQSADWRRHWVVAVAGLGLEAGASIDAAETALEVWDKASNDGENHRNRMRRVAGIQRNMSDFETEARALVQRCAPTAADLPPEAAARLLNDRLVAARAAQTKHHAGAELKETARRALDEARDRLGRAKETMATRAAQLPGWLRRGGLAGARG